MHEKKDINVVLFLSKWNKQNQKQTSKTQRINLLLKCLPSLSRPKRYCDWKKLSSYAPLPFKLTKISYLWYCKTVYFSFERWSLFKSKQSSNFWSYLPNITHQSILPWLYTGIQSALQMQNYRSSLCLHSVQPNHPYIQCHSWHTDVHSLRMHKVLDLLQLVYLKIDQISLFRFSNICELILLYEEISNLSERKSTYQPEKCWEKELVSSRDACLSDTWALQSENILIKMEHTKEFK